MTTPVTLAYSGVCPAPPGDARLLRLSHKAKGRPGARNRNHVALTAN
jgi:hypothetical protein